MTQMRSLISFFTSPFKGFEALLAAPRSLLVLVLIIVAAAASHAALCSRFDVEAVTRAANHYLSEEKGGKGSGISDTKVRKEVDQRLNMARISGYARLPVVIPGLAFLGGLLFWLLGLLLRRRVTFKGAFAVSAHVWIPLAIRKLMSIPVILAYPSLDPEHLQGVFKTDLASLMGAGKAIPGLFLVDPFLIWMAVSFGLACRAARFGKLKAVGCGLIAWIAFGFMIRVVS
jgi:hypothetical protein